MKKLILMLAVVLTLSGCSGSTYNTVHLNFDLEGEDYHIIADENANNYNDLLEDLEELNIELNSQTKIAVLTTSTANILDDLGMNIVGVTSSKNLNENLQAGLEDGTIMNLGSPISPNLEQLMLLDEEVAFVGSNMPTQEEYQSIENLISLPQVYYYDIFYTISALINKFDLDQSAQAVFNNLVQKDQMAKELINPDLEVNAAVLKYAYGNFTIAPDNTYPGSLASELSINNIYGDYSDIDMPLDKEKLLLDDPEYIILYGKGDEMSEDVERLLEDPTFKTLSAYKEDKVIIIESISLNADIDSGDTLLKLSSDIYGQ